jgi:hypothetical protein
MKFKNIFVVFYSLLLISCSDTIEGPEQNPTKGEIVINNYLHVTEFEGQYYEEIPITLEAVALDGYTFKGWTGDIESTDSVIEIILSHNMVIYPIFE